MTDHEDHNSNDEKELPPMSPVRVLADMYEQIQKLRIQCGNRISAVGRNVDPTPVPPALPRLLTTCESVETDLKRDMTDALATHPAWPWLQRVRGIGPTLATRLVCDIDIQRAGSVSALWRYAGYAVIDGARERPVKGEKLSYNIRLKTTVYLCVASFIKCGDKSPYAREYRVAREFYAANRPTWTKAHQHLAAMRKVGKLFLAHLWMVWREELSLDTRPLYVHDKLGHDNVKRPWDYVEPVPTTKKVRRSLAA